MSGDRSADLGSRLRRARERRGLSLIEVASSTKISLAILEALERNDLGRLPGGLFGRAFVRSFASEVGVDPDEAVQLFTTQAAHATSPARFAAGYLEDNDAFESDRQIASTVVRLVAISVPLIAIVLYAGAVGRRPQSSPVRATGAPPPEGQALTRVDSRGPGTDGAVSQGQGVSPVSVGRTADEVGAGDPRVLVTLVAARRCRISVTVDGRIDVDRQLEAGERHTLEMRRDLVVTADDGGAVTMTLNGVEARPLGGHGESATTRLNVNNFRDYLLTR